MKEVSSMMPPERDAPSDSIVISKKVLRLGSGR